MILTPGYTFNDSETVTAAKLNELGTPTVTLETGDVDDSLIDVPALVQSLGESATLPNYLHNGNFSEPYWQRGNTAISCPRVARTFRADWWFCRPATFDGSGGPCPGFLQYSRQTLTSITQPDIKSLHCAKLLGQTNYVAVDFGQDIPAHLAAALRTTITVSFQLYNDTNADLTPQLVFETPASINAFTGATTQVSSTTASTAVSDNNWHLFTFTVNAAGFANITNGLRVLIRFPSGALDGNTKSVLISQVKLERGSAATTFLVERDDIHDVEDSSGSIAAVARNFLENPQFAYERWVLSSLATTIDAEQFTAERWWVKASGASVGLARVALTTGIPVTGASHALEITGAGGVTTVRIGQNIEMTTAGELFQPAVFSIYLYNGTGTAFTPIGYIETCNAARNFATITSQQSTSFGSCPDSTWTRLEMAFNGSDWANFANGARVIVEIPSGALISGTVRFTAGQLELGAAASTWEPQPEFTDRAILTGFKNLTLYNSSGTALTISASDMILTNADGSAINTGAFSGLTINAATGGAGAPTVTGAGGFDTGTAVAAGWYRAYAVSDGSTLAAVLSPAASTVTLPTGYRYSAYLGECYITSVNPTVLRNFKQRDALGVQDPKTLVSGVVVTPSTFQSATAPARALCIPPSAIAIGGTMGTDANAVWGVALSGDGGTTGIVAAGGAAKAATFLSFNAMAPFWVALGDSQTISWTAASAINSVVAVSEYQLSSR